MPKSFDQRHQEHRQTDSQNYRDIRKLTQDSTSSLYRLKLYFKSSKTKTMMAKIESSKSTANLILGTVQLAVLQAQNVGKAQNVR